MKKIFRTTLIIGSSQICVIAIQIIRSKIVALIIGPAGVGVLGNTLVFLSLIENICLLGIHLAFLRYSSEAINQKKFKEASKFFSTAIFIHLITSSLGIIFSLLFLNRIGVGIYQDSALSSVFFFILLTIPLLILQSDFGNLFNAFNKVKLIGKINIISAISGLVVIAPLIFFFNLKGAIFSVFANALIMFFVVFYLYKKYFSDRIQIKKIFFSKNLALKMFKYGGANQLAIIINSLAAYFLRVFVTGRFFLSGAGIFNAASGIGSYILILQSPIGIYLYPKISSIYKNEHETGAEINNILRFCLIILAPIIICVLLFSDLLIQTLLSKEFLTVQTILPWILLVNFFEVLQSIISTPLFIMEKFKIYLGVNAIFNFILVSLSYIFLRKFNLVGMTLAMSIAYGLLFVFWLVASAIAFKFRIKKENILLLLTALILFFLTSWSMKLSLLIRLPISLIVLLWLLIVVKKTEWVALANYLKEHWPLNRRI